MIRKIALVRGAVLVCVVLLIAGVVIWYKFAFPTYTYRYRITIQVTVGDTVRSGSSVIEVRLRKQYQFLPEVPRVAELVSGEAVFVDLGDGRNLFALLASGPNGADVNFPQHVVPGRFKLSYSDSDLPKFPQLQGSWELTGNFVPTLVTFSDLDDPTTARVVRPEEFEQVFGKGVRFKRAYVEMTDDPVTHRIEKSLPWIGNYELEVVLERRLRATGDGGGGVLMPGMSLRRRA